MTSFLMQHQYKKGRQIDRQTDRWAVLPTRHQCWVWPGESPVSHTSLWTHSRTGWNCWRNNSWSRTVSNPEDNSCPPLNLRDSQVHRQVHRCEHLSACRCTLMIWLNGCGRTVVDDVFKGTFEQSDVPAQRFNDWQLLQRCCHCPINTQKQ